MNRGDDSASDAAGDVDSEIMECMGNIEDQNEICGDEEVSLYVGCELDDLWGMHERRGVCVTPVCDCTHAIASSCRSVQRESPI